MELPTDISDMFPAAYIIIKGLLKYERLNGAFTAVIKIIFCFDWPFCKPEESDRK